MGTDHSLRRRLASTAVLAALTILSVVALGLVLRSATEFTAAEMQLLRSVSLLHTPALDGIALAINGLFGPAGASVIVVLGVAIIAAASRRVTVAVHFLVIVTVPWLGNEAVKLVVHRTRPDIPSLAHPLIFEPGGLSYPSGHTSFATCLMLGIIVVFAARASQSKMALIIPAAVVALATGASRIYLGVHYPSDVVASYTYSIAAVALVNSAWMLLVVPHWSKRRAIAAHADRGGAVDAY